MPVLVETTVTIFTVLSLKINQRLAGTNRTSGRTEGSIEGTYHHAHFKKSPKIRRHFDWLTLTFRNELTIPNSFILQIYNCVKSDVNGCFWMLRNFAQTQKMVPNTIAFLHHLNMREFVNTIIMKDTTNVTCRSSNCIQCLYLLRQQ